MAKDPAFLFYPNDWLGGTLGMTFEEKGAYMELLMMQFNRGHMTTHMIGQVVGQIWLKIQHKFIEDEEGLWYNKRLEEEQKRRKAYTESRRNNVEGINQYTKKGKNNRSYEHKVTTHMEGHMEDENEIKDEPIYIPDWDEFCEYAISVKHDVNKEIMKAKYTAWKLDNWKDGKGKKIRNWKSKVNHNVQYWGRDNKSTYDERAGW